MVRAVALGALSLALSLSGCGGSADSPDGGSLGVCVDDPRASAGCQTRWELLDPCNLAGAVTTLEAAVFADQCPTDATLSAGDTSKALRHQSVVPGAALAPIGNLALDGYGFAFVLRDDSCRVIAWGCADANLSVITHVKTAVRNWGALDDCAAANTGGCVAPATCSAGVCK